MKLTDVLTLNRIKTDLSAENRDDSIKELIDLMKDQLSDIKQAYQAVLEREKIMTTGVGNGIAIPHCKDYSCPNFSIALGISIKGIDFQSIDKKDVHIIFLLLGPENNPGVHIKLLSRISRIMSQEEVRDSFLSMGDSSAIFSKLQEAEVDLPEIE